MIQVSIVVRWDIVCRRAVRQFEKECVDLRICRCASKIASRGFFLFINGDSHVVGIQESALNGGELNGSGIKIDRERE